MEERRRARTGTVAGLTLLVGGTAVTAVAGGTHSVPSSVALGILTLALAHSLLDEIRRQATRRSSAGWTIHDTVNTLVLGGGAIAAFVTALLGAVPVPVRLVAAALTLGYAAACLHLGCLRRRTVAAAPDRPAPAATGDPRTGALP